MHWYAVHTKPRQEKLGELSLQKLCVETFSPRLRQIKIVRRKRQTVHRPLFPGYLFARFDPDTHYRAVNYALGVRNLVSFGSDPAIVDDEIIESIKSRTQDGCVIVQPFSFRSGQTVRIHGGQLEGLEAVFEREMGDRQRVILLLQTLSYQARVVVALEQIVQC